MVALALEMAMQTMTATKESQIPVITTITKGIPVQVAALALEMAILAITTLAKVAQTLVETIILEITTITKEIQMLVETITKTMEETERVTETQEEK